MVTTAYFSRNEALDEITRAGIVRELRRIIENVKAGNPEYVFILHKAPGNIATSRGFWSDGNGPALLGIIELNRSQIAKQILEKAGK
jgi:hypothetical protein